ncbi:hypothetical protein AKG98_2860 [Moritella sp. JT01]|uniref:RHS repeat-associated core domain-containing protein n=1 Tax=Moritella sp. JT01 TaxID=756698 RepID=UPI000796AEE3|nr:RHS repeat-associated core domain-containing protein [Moritella sp. JT01]KXO06766.1 hypothetical protein AKG98_2860 [Moritella sp. JT01]
MSKKQFSGTVFNRSRRRFLKSTAAVSAASLPMVPGQSLARGLYASSAGTLRNNPLGFNGERQDPVTGCYHLGKGYRVYNPRLMRFHAYDSMSPFGRGGTHGYAYCLGDPINQRDPSGHFALLSLLIGAIVGAVIGAGIAAATEGIQCAINPEHKFDWKQVGIGAALGFISGGFGAAAQGAKTSVKVGLAVADAVFSGGADFGLNVAAGTPVKQAGINAGIGAVIGLGAFGVGRGIGKLGGSLSAASNRLKQVKTVGLSGRGGPKAAKLWAETKLYRGDSRNPLDVFRDGFVAQGNNIDPMAHLSFRGDSALVATTKLKSQAATYAFGRTGAKVDTGFLYKIKGCIDRPDAFDVVRRYPKDPAAIRNQEVLFQHLILPENIAGAYRVTGNRYFPSISRWNFIRNPNFLPRNSG